MEVSCRKSRYDSSGLFKTKNGNNGSSPGNGDEATVRGFKQGGKRALEAERVAKYHLDQQTNHIESDFDLASSDSSASIDDDDDHDDDDDDDGVDEGDDDDDDEVANKKKISGAADHEKNTSMEDDHSEASVDYNIASDDDDEEAGEKRKGTAVTTTTTTTMQSEGKGRSSHVSTPGDSAQEALRRYACECVLEDIVSCVERASNVVYLQHGAPLYEPHPKLKLPQVLR